MEVNFLSKPVYGVVDRGVFGLRVVTGIATGVQYTEALPLYKIEYKDGSVWTDRVTDTIDELWVLMEITPLEEVAKVHGLKVKYHQEDKNKKGSN